ncbi:hypothetical protein A9Q84_17565 [Halobacteriovorax marinus]|uniref:Transmembrane Acr-type transport protein n=1 Tax=Halobacteriovorax marinus TaxID=97084 RepID=A0A1Y5F8Z2_9BACT|nr:hypothetical protein A9Q84_17565 [Halobacteriovorax marinus]
MKNIILYAAQKHLLTNMIFVGTIIFAIFTWMNVGKEEMPEFASNWIRVTAVYPGAPAEDVELFVTKPLEDELKGVVGIEEVSTTSSVGVSSIRIILDDDYPNKEEVTQEIKDAILRTDLPSEVRNLPKMRQFKSAAKAILDIGIYVKGKPYLDGESRKKLQQYVQSFESQLLALKEISIVDRSYYRKPELQILVNPNENLKNEISLSEIRNQIKSNNIRVPIGSMRDRGESKVTAINELEDVKSLNSLILRGNYEGQGILLGDIATVKDGFEKSSSIFKVNGHEAVLLNIKKSVSTDILSAQKSVMTFIENFRKNNSDSPIEIVTMDDESFAVTNRLNIITKNGVIGFFLITLILLLFLDIKTGFWVAMGIPFSMGFTLIIAHLLGYTVNNMTLAGIIIVLGIVVDDAIIVAENISRHREEGMPLYEAVSHGTAEVFKPIVASILTTCVAFLPLLYFEGFFGKLVSFIPLVVILMLGGSLIESLFILPAHMAGKTPLLDRFKKDVGQKSWFHKYEDIYANVLLRIFNHRLIVLSVFVTLLAAGGYLFKTKMKFVMFPREESKELYIKVKARKGFVRDETARAIAPLEKMFIDSGANVVAVRSRVGLSRRGGEVKENEASINVELLPADQRSTPLSVLIKDWKQKSGNIKDLDSVKILRGRWGHSSGNSIEIQVQENDEEKRIKAVDLIEKKMKEIDSIVDVEVEKPLMKNEYLFRIKQDRLIRYNVTAEKVTSTLRSFVEGSILYSINKGDEEIDVRLSVPDDAKRDLKKLLDLRVENKSGRLVYLRKIVDIEEVDRPVNIKRTNFKRTTMIYANIEKGSDTTPLQIAEKLEELVFPKVSGLYPTTLITFKGEIEDTRESQGEFRNSVIMVVVMIFMILAIMFDSLTKPFLVLSIVPFALVGVVYVFILHGMSVYGFFAAIGALGMVGVVINDAIVMIDKFEKDSRRSLSSIAKIASTRLRPVLVTTITTVVGILPTAYGIAGHDSMLAEMMLAMGWGLVFATCITLVLIPCLYTFVASEE